MKVSDRCKEIEALDMYSVYHIHVDPNLSSGYVGISKNVKLRFAQHGWKRKNTNNHLQNALAKYGNTVKFSVLANELDYEAASLLEKMLRPNPNMGWNISTGGNIPPNPQGKLRSKEYRANIAKAKLGKNNPMFGKKMVFSEEHRKNLSVAGKGKTSALKGVKRPTTICPHCGISGGVGAMGRWHFNRCKNASI